MRLRGGARTKDKRLDRIVQFDRRSRRYPVRQFVEGKKPRSFTWRINEIFDQGNEGACVGFGMTHELVARPSEVKGLNRAFARRVYREAKKIDPWEGEDYEGTSVLAGIEVIRKMGYIDAYYWCFGIEDVVLALGYHGPVVLGIPWFEKMVDTDDDGFIYPINRILGGHCVILNKINASEGWVSGPNSWGEGWGIDGFFKLHIKDLEFILSQEGEAVVFSGRHKK